MMPTKENGYVNYLMTLGLVLGALIGTIIGIFVNQLLYGIVIGIVIGYGIGTLIYFIKAKKEMNKQKEN